MMIDETGWLSDCKSLASPNFDRRPEDTVISLLVLHNISLPPNQYGGGHIQDFFCNRLDSTRHPYFVEIAPLKVSSHLLIDREGEITQFVSFQNRAWHAGVSCFDLRENCNNFSIGIELEGSDIDSYTEHQYLQLQSVAREIILSYPHIKLDRIVGHCDIAPGRKTDPGLSFDWQRFLSNLREVE